MPGAQDESIKWRRAAFLSRAFSPAFPGAMIDLRWRTTTLLVPLLWGVSIADEVDYSQFVNPFIGSEGAIRGYACKHPLLEPKRLGFMLTVLRWRRRHLCRRSCAIWHGEARPRYLRGACEPECAQWRMDASGVGHWNQHASPVRHWWRTQIWSDLEI